MYPHYQQHNVKQRYSRGNETAVILAVVTDFRRWIASSFDRLSVRRMVACATMGPGCRLTSGSLAQAAQLPAATTALDCEASRILLSETRFGSYSNCESLAS